MKKLLTFAALLVVTGVWAQPLSVAKGVYLNPKQPIESRVEDLLARKPLEEKVNQLTIDYARTTAPGNRPGPLDPLFHSRLRQGLGAIPYVNLAHDAGQDAEFSNSIQRYILDDTRLRIPALLEGEALHGLIAFKAMSFPHAIALASTWDPDLVIRVYDSAVRQTRSRGNHVMFTLKAFKRVSLNAGETKTIQLALVPSTPEMINVNFDCVIEPREFESVCRHLFPQAGLDRA